MDQLVLTNNITPNKVKEFPNMHGIWKHKYERQKGNHATKYIKVGNAFQ
jgi:hypothetical protein